MDRRCRPVAVNRAYRLVFHGPGITEEITASNRLRILRSFAVFG